RRLTGARSISMFGGSDRREAAAELSCVQSARVVRPLPRAGGSERGCFRSRATKLEDAIRIFAYSVLLIGPLIRILLRARCSALPDRLGATTRQPNRRPHGESALRARPPPGSARSRPRGANPLSSRQPVPARPRDVPSPGTAPTMFHSQAVEV